MQIFSSFFHTIKNIKLKENISFHSGPLWLHIYKTKEKEECLKPGSEEKEGGDDSRRASKKRLVDEEQIEMNQISDGKQLLTTEVLKYQHKQRKKRHRSKQSGKRMTMNET